MIIIVHKYVWRWKVHLIVPAILVMNCKKTGLRVQVTNVIILYNFFAYDVQMFYSDIDECIQGLAGCSQNCNNTAGSYFCTCMDGFELGSGNHTCTGDYD